MIPIEFKVTGSKANVKPLLQAHCIVRSICFDPFTWSTPNLVHGLSSMSRWSPLIFRSHVQRSRSNHSSHPTVLSAQYLLTPSLDSYQTWCMGCPISKWSLLIFRSHVQDQVQTTLLSLLCCPLYIFKSLAFLLWTGFASTEKINLKFAQWGHICFGNISCLKDNSDMEDK